MDAVTAIRPLRGATEAAIAATKQWQYQPVFYQRESLHGQLSTFLFVILGLVDHQLRGFLQL